MGSNPIWTVLYLWRISSAGRASALQAGGHRFEPCILHIFLPKVLYIVAYNYLFLVELKISDLREGDKHGKSTRNRNAERIFRC